MAEEDQDQKTEQPTYKRLEEARNRGQLPVSKEISAWVLFLGVLATVAWMSPGVSHDLLKTLRVFIEMPHSLSLEGLGLQAVMFHTLMKVGAATAFVFVVLLIAASAGTLAQTGFFATMESIKPDLDRLSILNGIKRIFSMNALAELVKSFIKMIVFGFVVFITLLPVAQALPGMADYSIPDILSYLHDEAVHIIMMLLLVFTLVAVGDLFYQRYTYFKNLRMSKAEVKDEFKQQEGDPIIKARLRQIRLEKARKRMMAQVPKADVVVTNPTHYAVAMGYDTATMAAPTVLAKGVNRVAERIREVAEEHKVPLVSNPPLARALYDTVEVDEEIPTQHYRAVAEVISYVYKLKKRGI